MLERPHMLVRIASHFLNTDDIYHVEFSKDEEENLVAVITLRRDGESKEITFSNGPAEYLQTILDAHHVISIQHIRDTLPELT